MHQAAAVAIQEPTGIERRREERHEGLVERATILFRGAELDVPVVNISSRGTQIQSDIVPRLGETISIRFEDCTRIQSFVRWVRDGRIGLNFGHEILLG